MEKKYSLRDASKEELQAFNDDLAAVMLKHEVEIKTVPIFVPTSEGKYLIDSNVILYKKVELIPKEEGVKSPFVPEENGGNNSDKTEEENKAD